MSRKQLTAKQHAFLEYLAEHVRRHKVWPTYRELVQHFGYRSPNSVTQNLQALAKKGYLTRDNGGYRLVGQRNGLPGGGFPVQGEIAGGTYTPALSIEEVTLRDLFPELEGAYALRMGQPVRGVEDVGAGDYLLVEETDDVPKGTFVVALVRGEAVVARYFEDGNVRRLAFQDGTQAYFAADDPSLRVLGRYMGYLNRKGLRRVPERGESRLVQDRRSEQTAAS